MKKTKTVSLALFIGALALFTVFTLSGCDEADKTYTVKYEITGPSIIADVSYSNETGNLNEISNVQIPWEKTITVTGKIIGLSCYMSQHHPYTGDTYTATIYVDGRVFKTASSSTGLVVVTGTINNYIK